MKKKFKIYTDKVFQCSANKNKKMKITYFSESKFSELKKPEFFGIRFRLCLELNVSYICIYKRLFYFLTPKLIYTYFCNFYFIIFKQNFIKFVSRYICR